MSGAEWSPDWLSAGIVLAGVAAMVLVPAWLDSRRRRRELYRCLDAYRAAGLALDLAKLDGSPDTVERARLALVAARRRLDRFTETNEGTDQP